MAKTKKSKAKKKTQPMSLEEIYVRMGEAGIDRYEISFSGGHDQGDIDSFDSIDRIGIVLSVDYDSPQYSPTTGEYNFDAIPESKLVASTLAFIISQRYGSWASHPSTDGIIIVSARLKRAYLQEAIELPVERTFELKSVFEDDAEEMNEESDPEVSLVLDLIRGEATDETYAEILKLQKEK